jgi:mercuric ion binding protein
MRFVSHQPTFTRFRKTIIFYGVNMKTMRKILTGAGILLILSIAQAEEAVYTIQVDGLSCPFCAYGIEKQLSAIDGVGSVAVNISKGLVNITMQQNKRLGKEQAQQAVTDAGFTLRSFKQSNKETPDVPGQ